MGAMASLSAQTLSAEAGGQVTCEIRVRNTGQIVDAFTFDVLGDAASWAAVDPPILSLFPGSEETATLTFRPPRAPTTLAGSVPFAVRVNSREDPQGSVVEEGVLEVFRFTDVSAELLPRTSHGRRSARHELAVDNRSNYRVNTSLSASDPDDQLLFAMGPPGLVVEPGHAGFSRVLVRPRKSFWKGSPRTRAFQVLVAPEDEAPVIVDGTYVQQQRMPRYLVPLLLGLLALGILGAALWFGLLKPQIRSQAKSVLADAGIPPDSTLDIAGIQAAADQAAGAAQAAEAAAAAAQAAAEQAGQAVTPTAPPAAVTPIVNVSVLPGVPFDGRLLFTPAQTENFVVVPAEATVTITDLFFQNPNGDFGVMQLVRILPDTTQRVLLVNRLENFRDLDFHYVSPLVFTAGEQLRLLVACENAFQAPPIPEDCAPSASFSGFFDQAPAPPP